MSRHWKTHHPYGSKLRNDKELVSYNLRDDVDVPFPTQDYLDYWNDH